jgi:hypothetical protein
MLTRREGSQAGLLSLSKASFARCLLLGGGNLGREIAATASPIIAAGRWGRLPGRERPALHIRNASHLPGAVLAGQINVAAVAPVGIGAA